MSSAKTVAIDGEIVKINCGFSRSDRSSTISLQFFKLDPVEACLSVSGTPVTCNIAHHQTVVYSFAEVVETKTGLYRHFLLCGPVRLHSSAREASCLRLYTVENREITLFREFQLPVSRQTCLSELTFDISDGPIVCFVTQSDVYVTTPDGAVQTYKTAVDSSFRHLTSLVQDGRLLVIGLVGKSRKHSSVSQTAMMSLCIDTSKQLSGCHYNALVPDVYLGMKYR